MMSKSELYNLLLEAAETGANIALEKAGLKKEFITAAEISKTYGRRLAEQAKAAIENWYPHGRGMRCRYCDFQNWMKMK